MPDEIHSICLHEDAINGQSRKIAELETRADYKERMIDDLNEKMDKIVGKLDTLVEGFNELKLQSTKDDTKLELRLTTIETELKTLKNEIKDKEKEDKDRINRQLVVIGLLFSAITIGLNVIFKFI